MRKSLAIISGMTLASTMAFAASGAGFSDLDADGNGSLNKSEVKAAGMDFAAVDANGDGKVSKEEFKTAADAMKEGGESAE